MNKSKNILITGVSTGVGYALAKIFVNSGYVIYGSVRKEEDAERLKKDFGLNFHPLLFDVTDHKAVDFANKELEEHIGDEGLGGLINNAGVAVGGPFMNIDIEEYRYQFEVNVIGLVRVTQAFLPLLGARKNHAVQPGKVFQISSVSGKMGMPFLSPYVGSKHAIEGISHCLRRELQLFGIDVITIGPGPIKTPIWDKGINIQQEAKYKNSPFYRSLKIFQDVFVADAIKHSWTSERTAEIILNIFEKNNPKTRYTLVSQRFKNWTLPRLLPARMLDKFLQKNLKLSKGEL